MFLKESSPILLAGCGDNNIYGFDMESNKPKVKLKLKL